MEDHIFKEQIYTYQDLLNGEEIKGDDYGLVRKSLCPPRKKTFLSNPFLVDYDSCVLYLQKADGIVVGNNTLIPCKFKADKDIIDCCGGSNLIVVEKYRRYGIGAYHILYPIKHSGKDVIIYASLSMDALKSYRAIKFFDFRIKRYWQIRNSEFLFDKYKIRGLFKHILTFIVDKTLRLIRFVNDLNANRSGFVVREVKIVPEWIDDIVLNDGHKYMELHDYKWMQWNLDNMFYNIDGNKNRFYTIEKEGVPFGFFFIKYRRREFASYTSSKLFCSIMEWGSKNEQLLSEGDIYEMALNEIDEDVDIVEFTSNCVLTQNRMKRKMFFHYGDHYIVFKDVKNKFKDAKDPSLWRLRYGYSDSIFN